MAPVDRDQDEVHAVVSRENAELIRFAIEAYMRDGLAAVDEVWDPEIEFHEDPAFPESGVYRGARAIDAYFAQFRQHFEGFSFEVEEAVEAGEKVLALIHLRMRARGGDAHVDQRAGWVFTVRDGKVLRIEGYLDRDVARRAAGLE